MRGAAGTEQDRGMGLGPTCCSSASRELTACPQVPGSGPFVCTVTVAEIIQPLYRFLLAEVQPPSLEDLKTHLPLSKYIHYEQLAQAVAGVEELSSRAGLTLGPWSRGKEDPLPPFLSSDSSV